MTKGYGLTILQNKGTTRIPSLINVFVTFIIFFLAGLVDFKIGTSLIIGNFLGSYFGSHVVIKKGDAWIKPIMIIVIIIVSLKLIIF